MATGVVMETHRIRPLTLGLPGMQRKHGDARAWKRKIEDFRFLELVNIRDIFYFSAHRILLIFPLANSLKLFTTPIP